MPKKLAISAAKSGMRLTEFVKAQKPRQLSSELIPSWVARAAR
jgi:hypothetical protein